jgi:hypothetical protein
LRFFATLFATHGLLFSLEAGGKLLFRFGHDVSPNWLARLLGLAPAYLPLTAIGLLLRR